MKKVLLIGGLSAVLALTACGNNDEASAEPENDSEPTAASTQEVDNDVEEDETADEPEEEPAADEDDNDFGDSVDETGEFYEEGFGFMKTVGIGYNDEVGIDGTDAPLKPIEMGPMELYINGMAVVDVEPESEVSYLFNEEEKVRAVIVDMSVHNTSEDDITFHPNQATLVTSTGEQVESEIFLMGEAGGDFYGGVKKEDQTWWLLNDLDTDIENIKMIISPPTEGDSWEGIGEEKRLDFEILSWEEAEERDSQ